MRSAFLLLGLVTFSVAQESTEVLEVDPGRDPDDTVRLFYRGLRSPDPAVRHSAERAILAHGFEAVPPLRALAAAGPAWQKEAAARLLASLEPRFVSTCDAAGLARFDFSPDGDRLVVQTGPWEYDLRRTADGARLGRMVAEKWRDLLPVEAFAKDADADLWLHDQPRFSRDGERVFVGNVLARLLTIDGRTARPGHVLPDEGFLFSILPQQLEEVAELEDGTTIFAGLDGTGIRTPSDLGLLDLPGAGPASSHLGWAVTPTHILRSSISGRSGPLELFVYERRRTRMLGVVPDQKIRAVARATIREAVDWLATDGVSELAFAAGFDSTRIHILAPHPPEVLSTSEVQASPITALAGCESRPWIATGGEDGVVRIFLSTTLERVATLEAGDPVEALRFSRDGSALGAYAKGRVKVFRIR